MQPTPLSSNLTCTNPIHSGPTQPKGIGWIKHSGAIATTNNYRTSSIHKYNSSHDYHNDDSYEKFHKYFAYIYTFDLGYSGHHRH